MYRLYVVCFCRRLRQRVHERKHGSSEVAHGHTALLELEVAVRAEPLSEGSRTYLVHEIDA